jgi:3-hydroxyacyl-CoA dehydrogenase
VPKWISVIVSGVIGSALAAVAAWGVISTSTQAPKHNPATSSQMVPYGP